MLTQSDRLALYFEIPAVFDRLLAELAICGDVAFPVFVAAVGDLLTGRVQLADQPLQTTADARQRGGALFLELLEEALVLGAGVVDSHGHILSDPLHVLQREVPGTCPLFVLTPGLAFAKAVIALSGFSYVPGVRASS